MTKEKDIQIKIFSDESGELRNLENEVNEFMKTIRKNGGEIITTNSVVMGSQSQFFVMAVIYRAPTPTKTGKQELTDKIIGTDPVPDDLPF